MFATQQSAQSMRSVVWTSILALLATLLVIFPGTPSSPAKATGGGFSFIDVAAGARHTIAIGSDGLLYGWGSNAKGEIGDGTTVLRDSPVAVSTSNSNGITFTSVAAGEEFSLALASDGSLFAWGGNLEGRLGVGSDAPSFISSVPVRAATSVTFSQISAGQNHAAALTAGGELYTWGSDDRGQLGNGSLAGTSSPALVDPGRTYSAISAGWEFTVGISAGAAYAWGYNKSGQLGNGSSTEAFQFPTAVSATSMTGVITYVSAGRERAFAVDSNGNGWGWGYNRNADFADQWLGAPAVEKQRTPVEVIKPSGLTFVAIDTGDSHTTAIMSNYQIFSWGRNSNSQLGTSTSTLEKEAKAASTLSSQTVTFSRITNGTYNGNHNFALGSDGNIYGWGRNSEAQLGNGSTTNVAVPTALTYAPAPSPVLGSALTTPSSIELPLTCGGSCGAGNSYNYVATITAPGGTTSTLSGAATAANTTLSFTALSSNIAHTIQVSVTYNGETSATVSTTVTTPKPTATISALVVTDTTATLTLACLNCGAVPTSFTASATPVAGGSAVTSNTNVISGLSSETTYSFSVVVAFAGTTSDEVLWQGNPFMTLPMVPVISSVNPSNVPLAGASITVTGSNFTTSSLLTLDGASLAFTVVSGTSITFTAPGDTAGSYDLAITNPVGTFTLSNAISYIAGPSLSTNSPVLATSNGGTLVTLTGTALSTTKQVNLGSTTVSFSVISDTAVRFTTPSTSSGIVDIGVMTVGGVSTLSSALEITDSPLIPVVSAISPASGDVAGGTTITVTGKYFSGSYSQVVSAAINGVSGSSVVLVDDSTLTFVSPAGAAASGLDVSIATGAGSSILAGVFTYTAAPPQQSNSAPPASAPAGPSLPSVGNFTVPEIPTTGGDVTVRGENMQGITSVEIGGIPVTLLSSDEGSFTFRAGTLPAGVWDLKITGPFGTLVFQGVITVVEAKAVTASTADRLGWTWTRKFTGNSRVLSVAQQRDLDAKFERYSKVATLICWGYTTSSSPKAWAIAHAKARATAACDYLGEQNSLLKTVVRLRYGADKKSAMRTTLQFWGASGN